MNDPALVVERYGRVLVIWLSRPHVRNAVNHAMARQIAAVLDLLDADTGLAVGVLTGAGTGFCAGMDLKAFVTEGEPVVVGRGFAGITERPPAKPLIAAVEGFAVAGGLEIALSCDLIVAARDAVLGLPEVKRSLVATGGGLLRLAKRIPYHVAMELALSGEYMSAQRLYDVGLINRLAEPGEALDQALALARQLAANGPGAVLASKQILAAVVDWTREVGWQRQRELADPVNTSLDAQEGAAAFVEGRPPSWQRGAS